MIPHNKAIFLDRDGVINHAIVRDGKPYSPQSLDELAIISEAQMVLPVLKERGFRLLVVTNQPDVARGRQTREAVEAIHARLMDSLPLDQIYTCYHDDADCCTCRKPLPGLILQGAQDWDVDLANSYVIGDRWKDIEAGTRAGCTTLLIGTGYGEQPSLNLHYHLGSLLEVPGIVDRTLWGAR